MMMKEEEEGEKENESEKRCCGLAEREMQKQSRITACAILRRSAVHETREG